MRDTTASASSASTSEQGFSAESYFATQHPPANLDVLVASVRTFVDRQIDAGRNVVLVTSGGTTVPLELNVVRFLDNFSAGTRGATSAEYFLEAGYAVIFMHRQFSLQPFSRHYSHSTNPFLDFLDIALHHDCGIPPSDARTADDSMPLKQGIHVTPSKREDLLSVLSQYKRVQREGTLHTLTFVTVNDYLWLLRAVSQVLGRGRRRALYYLAAAVSDFFLPRQKLSEHKIQSGKGSLLIEMDQVPKILKTMVDEWTRDGFIVSFKLETDPALLIPKARAALERYGHQVVIGNDLANRKWEVVFVERRARAAQVNTTADDPDQEFTETWLRILHSSPISPTSPHGPSSTAKEIEEDIVEELVKRHKAWIDVGP